MRVACLVMAYQGARVLRESLPLYRRAGWDVFVHLDLKADLDQYRRDLADAESSCHFLNDRLGVFWGGYTMMRAEFALVEAARAQAHYDRLLLLSDDAFPLYPSATLNEVLSREGEYITTIRVPKGGEYDRRYTDFFLYDHTATSPRLRGHYSPRVDEALIEKIGRLASLRAEGKVALDVYFGSQFWCLSARTLDRVMEICRSDSRLCQSFEFACLSDELMFQSIIGNYLPEVKPVGSPMFADFTQGHGPLVYSSFAELPHAVSPFNIFLRKFSPNATAFVQKARARLEAGRKLVDVPQHDKAFDSPPLEEPGDPIYMFKLTAPSAPAATGGMWHGPETHQGHVPYRWTASSNIEWTIAHPPRVPCRLSVVIPLLMWTVREHRAACKLSFNGRTVPVQLLGSNLVAEIEVADPIENLQIVLSTPPPVSPAELWGKADRRKLGFAIPMGGD